MEADWLRESFFSSHQVTLKIASHAPDVSSRTLSLCVIGRVSCKCHSTCTKKEAPGFCQRKALQQPYLAHGQTPPTDALAALIGIPPLILNTCPVFKMHLINEISIRKTYADSRYRDRGPLTILLSKVNLYLQGAVPLFCTYFHLLSSNFLLPPSVTPSLPAPPSLPPSLPPSQCLTVHVIVHYCSLLPPSLPPSLSLLPPSLPPLPLSLWLVLMTR